MKYYYYGITDKGKVRKNNEDDFLINKISDNELAFAVADGMGGHLAGEVASKTAINILSENLKKIKGSNINKKLESILNNINETLLKMGKDNDDYWGLGTTLSILYITDNQAYIGHIGDSRLYRFSKSKLIQLSEDHSFVAKLLKDKIISEDEAKTHPKRNLLTQSLGMLYNEIKPQINGPFEIKKGDKFLLCSDGLHGFVDRKPIIQGLKQDSPEKSAKYLLNLALQEGGHDNITIITVFTEINNKSTKKSFKKILKKLLDG